MSDKKKSVKGTKTDVNDPKNRWKLPNITPEELEKMDQYGDVPINDKLREKYKFKYFRAKKRTELTREDFLPPKRPPLREKTYIELDESIKEGIPKNYRCTFTIYIDEFLQFVDAIRLNPQSFFKKLFASIKENIPEHKIHRIQFARKFFPITVQQPVHKDEDTVYVQVDGNLYEFSNLYSFFFEIVDLKHNRYIMEKAIKIVERNLQWVKEEMENVKEAEQIDNEYTRLRYKRFYEKKKNEES